MKKGSPLTGSRVHLRNKQSGISLNNRCKMDKSVSPLDKGPQLNKELGVSNQQTGLKSTKKS